MQSLTRSFPPVLSMWRDVSFPTRGSARFVPVIIVAVVTLIVLLHRNPALFLHPAFVAEDLIVMFNEDRLFGARAFFNSYAGYYLVAPRVIAFVTGFAPPIYAPRLYAIGFIGVILGSAAMIYTSPVYRGWSKVLAALAIVLSPVGSETVIAMCFTGWIMAPIVALALYERPSTTPRASLLIGYFALVGLSGPFVALAVPFALLKAFIERTRYSLLLAATAVLVTLVLLFPLLDRVASAPRPGTLLGRLLTGRTILYSWLTGSQYRNYTINDTVAPMVQAATISVIFIAVAGWYLWRNWSVARGFAIYFLAYGFVVLLAGCSAFDPGYEFTPFEMGARYFYPTVVLCILAFIAIEQNFERSWLTFRVFAILMLAIHIFRVPSITGSVVDLGWPATVRCLETSTKCRSEYNPRGFGSVLVPSDNELAHMTPAEREDYRAPQKVRE